MREILRKASDLEEATLGRVFSVQGLKYLGLAMVTGAVMDKLHMAWDDRRYRKAAEAALHEVDQPGFNSTVANPDVTTADFAVQPAQEAMQGARDDG